jgi:hypothetical protein
MLGFYLIDDNKPKSGPTGLKYAGGLDDETFYSLQDKGIIDERFDYYKDFRWGTEILKQIRQTIIKKNIKVDADVKKLFALLDIAEKNNTGLIAYCD